MTSRDSITARDACLRVAFVCSFIRFGTIFKGIRPVNMPISPWQKSHGVARQGSVVAGQARGGVDARASATTSNAAQRPQTPGALWVAAAWARLRCNASSAMTRHRLDRRALHPDPRRSQRDPRDFCHGLLSSLLLDRRYNGKLKIQSNQ